MVAIYNEIKIFDLVLCADWDRNYGQRMEAKRSGGKGSCGEGAPTFIYLYIFPTNSDQLFGFKYTWVH